MVEDHTDWRAKTFEVLAKFSDARARLRSIRSRMGRVKTLEEAKRMVRELTDPKRGAP